MARRVLTQADRDAWDAYVGDGKSKSEKVGLTMASPLKAPKIVQAAPPTTRFLRITSDVPLSLEERPPGVDGRSLVKLRQAKLHASQTLDLHGCSTQLAFQLFQDFMRRAHAAHSHTVEIITGRGSDPKGGTIRKELMHWVNLDPVRQLVIAAAHPDARNVGAVRLLLRPSNIRPCVRQPSGHGRHNRHR